MQISIITPSYNQREFVEKTLRSVRNQTGVTYEHLIFDANSTDGTGEILREYVESNANARLFSGKDGGQADAISKGFMIAKGDIVTWLNTDDFYPHEGVLKRVSDVFSQDDSIDVVYGQGRFLSPNGEILRDVFINENASQLVDVLFTSVGILQPALFLKRRMFEKVGLMDDSMRCGFDYEYWLRMIFAGARFRHCPEIFAHATFHSEAKSSAQRVVQLWDSYQATRRHFGLGSAEWLQRWRDAIAYDASGIIVAKSQDNAANNPHADRLLRRAFAVTNPAWSSRAAGLLVENLPRAGTTRDYLSELPGDRADRVIVTTFDHAYLEQGITLIASLHRVHAGSIPVIVYDLGLTEDDRTLLRALENVYVRPYPSEAAGAYPEFLHPKSYGYKCIAFSDVLRLVSLGTKVLWVDAGVSVIHSIDTIFDHIASDEVFFVDHDDKASWPFYNGTFTHPEAVELMQATSAELFGEHLCSCLYGTVKGGRFEALFRDAAGYALQRAAVVHSKHVLESDGPVGKKPPKSGEARAIAKDIQARANLTHEQARTILGYLGHRQDQSIYSILAARYGAPISSARRFCASTDQSSVASLENWRSGSVWDALDPNDQIPKDVQDSITFHHRGTYLRTDGLIRREESIRPLVLIGNGPSLKGFDFAQFEGHDTFGLNAAYRYWDEIGWYPTYYGCLDVVVGMSHRHEIERLISERHINGIKLFVLRKNVVEAIQIADGDRSFVIDYDALMKDSAYFGTLPLTTGSHVLLVGAILGYRRIKVVGVDLNYVEFVSGAESLGGIKLELRETPKDNPNYFFDGYQRQGDRYNIPNPEPDLHRNAWRAVAEAIAPLSISVVNCNPSSGMDAFPRMSWEAALKEDLRFRGRDALPGLPESVLPIELPREQKGNVDETHVVAQMFRFNLGRQHVMLDVGAHFGGSAEPFRKLDWSVFCFEPDPENRVRLQRRFAGDDGVMIDPRAVSDTVRKGIAFFGSPESTGVSGLNPFLDSHQEKALVDVTTVAEIVDFHALTRIDFLKIDVEGFDFSVIRGVPWDRIKPEVIECEFEDRKTAKMGHGYRDIANYLVARGYSVYVSEWHPILRYGQAHDWRCLRPYPCDPLPEDAWGNLLAFRKDPGFLSLQSQFSTLLRRNLVGAAQRLQALVAETRLSSARGSTPPDTPGSNVRKLIPTTPAKPRTDPSTEQRLAKLTLDWNAIPGEPLNLSSQVREVETEAGLAIETSRRLQILVLRSNLRVAKGLSYSVSHKGRLAKPHENAPAKTSFLIVARVFDKQNKYLGAVPIGNHPAEGAWTSIEKEVAANEVIKRFPGAAIMRISVLHNWVDDPEIGSSGNGASQSTRFVVRGLDESGAPFSFGWGDHASDQAQASPSVYAPGQSETARPGARTGVSAASDIRTAPAEPASLGTPHDETARDITMPPAPPPRGLTAGIDLSARRIAGAGTSDVPGGPGSPEMAEPATPKPGNRGLPAEPMAASARPAPSLPAADDAGAAGRLARTAGLLGAGAVAAGVLAAAPVVAVPAALMATVSALAALGAVGFGGAAFASRQIGRRTGALEAALEARLAALAEDSHARAAEAGAEAARIERALAAERDRRAADLADLQRQFSRELAAAGKVGEAALEQRLAATADRLTSATAADIAALRQALDARIAAAVPQERVAALETAVRQQIAEARQAAASDLARMREGLERRIAEMAPADRLALLDQADRDLRDRLAAFEVARMDEQEAERQRLADLMAELARMREALEAEIAARDPAATLADLSARLDGLDAASRSLASLADLEALSARQEAERQRLADLMAELARMREALEAQIAARDPQAALAELSARLDGLDAASRDLASQGDLEALSARHEAERQRLADLMAELARMREALEAQIAARDPQAALAELSARLDGLDAASRDLASQGDLEALSARQEAERQRLADLLAELARMREALEAQIAARDPQAALAELSARLDGLDAASRDLASQGDLEALSARQEAERQRLADLMAELARMREALEAQIAARDPQAALAELSARLDGLDAASRDLASQGDLEALSARQEAERQRLRQDMGPLFERMEQLAKEQQAFARAGDLASLSGRLDQLAGVKDDVAPLAQALAGVRSTVEALSKSGQALGERVQSLEPDLARVKSQLGEAEAARLAEQDGIKQRLAELRAEIGALHQRYGGLDDFAQRLEAGDTELRQRLEKLVAGVAGLDKTIAEARAAADAAGEKAARAEAKAQDPRVLGVLQNRATYQSFNRSLRPEHVKALQDNWLRRLSLPATPNGLAYLADRICVLEGHLRGRLATTIEDAVLRCAVAKSIKTENVDILEIGTLFGIGGAMLHEAVRSSGRQAHLTLLDPLEGYYSRNSLDIVTQHPVDEPTLRANLALAQIPAEDVTLIKAFSTDPEALAAAAERRYDMLVIDGDHSYSGVAADFRLYGPLVKVGGYILFDDYGQPDWPDVKRYVDDEMPSCDWCVMVGVEWRTAVFRVVSEPPRSGAQRRRTGAAVKSASGKARTRSS